MTVALTCRRAEMTDCDGLAGVTSGAAPFVNTIPLQIAVGEILDVGIIWQTYCAANGCKIKSSTWAEADDSPDTVDMVDASSKIAKDFKRETAVSIDASAAEAGDVYHLVNTVVMEFVSDSPTEFADRTLKRRVQVGVVLG